jgi:hypothetical protein
MEGIFSGVCNSKLWPRLVPKNFQDFLSHQMLGHMHGALNVDEKKTNYTVW